MTLTEKTSKLKESSYRLASVSNELRNEALLKAAASLRSQADLIISENKKDLENAEKQDLAYALVKRLAITGAKLEQMALGLESLAVLPDPLGQSSLHRELDEGLVLNRKSVPIGLIGVIFESRPDALVQIAGLCMKSGNSVILKGGSEALNSNRILSELIISAAESTDEVFKDTIMLVESREDISKLLEMDQYIDLMIPRGSNALVRYIMDNTKIPVMGHSDGICHMFVDENFDLEQSLELIRDAKCQYPAVCNAIETLLVHEKSADKLIPRLPEMMPDVKLLGDETVCSLISVEAATDEDWDTEYNDLTLSVKVVGGLEEAIDFINLHGSHHTDCILTSDEANASVFMARVDSSSVMKNCSTRFADGFRYGFGAEVGIATGKIHSRGPVGLEGLTIYKYFLEGSGHKVQPYADGEKDFTHKDL
ncbi:MAG: glutamate-5-semialdehyde dehydrogenase [Spirochaetales bacterium]|uniref:Gamma-glutamyl phosphate reductase n=1 Tax=Candidatus Thalassospirochaeta sargassi TaxID=3119039 RepID=A0AAJ1I9P6_9SPIO|nr:glutamate-5-semialdehyde dehydrogenase [Spirochaetales bacterium]